MKALLIGGSGATGVPIAHGLRDSGYDVTILHRGVHEPDEIASFRHIHADPHFGSSVSDALGDARFDAVILGYGRVAELAPLFERRCGRLVALGGIPIYRSEEHTSELQSLMRISYAVFCLKNKNK